MKLLSLIFFFTVFACNAQTKPSPKDDKTLKTFYKELRNQFAKIDSLQQHYEDYDSLDNENEKVIAILKHYKEKLFEFPDSLDYDLIYLVKSKDKSLVLISWDRRTGGTWLDFTTMAVFKTDKGIECKMLLDSAEKSSQYTYMHYNSITTIKTLTGKKIYLAWGNGQGSTAIPWQGLRAFSINNNRLIQPKIFPGNDFRLFVEFDLHAFKENEEVPVIRIKQSGKLIEVPEEGENEGFSGKYKSYFFDGKVYRTKHTKVKTPAYGPAFLSEGPGLFTEPRVFE